MIWCLGQQEKLGAVLGGEGWRRLGLGCARDMSMVLLGLVPHPRDEVVGSLDLSAIYASYEELRGSPPYDPRMMVKVWVYALMKGVRSSTKIERALYEDVGFRFLSANQQPDHWTVSEFRRRHHKALGGLFEQTVRMAEKAGLVKMRQVAIDGTKIKANASKHSAMSYGHMKKEEQRLREEIERMGVRTTIRLRLAYSGYPAVLTAALMSSSVTVESTLHRPIILMSMLSGRGSKT